MIVTVRNTLQTAAEKVQSAGRGFKRGSFLLPTVADGKVLVASDGQVAVFGLRV